jgi:hypothetical protein
MVINVPKLNAFWSPEWSSYLAKNVYFFSDVRLNLYTSKIKKEEKTWNLLSLCSRTGDKNQNKNKRRKQRTTQLNLQELNMK